MRVVIFLRPLHAGTVGGNFTRILWVLLGLFSCHFVYHGISAMAYAVESSRSVVGLVNGTGFCSTFVDLRGRKLDG